MAALKSSSLNCRIIGACIGHESLGLYFSDTAYIVPLAADPSFIDRVIEICNTEEVDIILTGVEENVYALESTRSYWEKRTRAIFISSPKEQLEIGLNKYQTAKWLKENDCNFPQSADAKEWNDVTQLIDTIGFPVIAKPNSGKGSSGIFIAKDWKELEAIKGMDYCVQELIGDQNNEYTVACYVDRRGREQEMLIMHRKLKAGTTFMAEIVQDRAIEEECAKICRAFKPIGPLNIQMRIHNGKPICFELNVRFSGTTPIRAHWGYNDVEALVNEYVNDVEVNLHPFMEGKVYRYYNEAFIDVNMQKALKDTKYVENVNQYDNFKEQQ